MYAKQSIYPKLYSQDKKRQTCMIAYKESRQVKNKRIKARDF